jgi:cell division protein FtsW (lipid II flippase)
MMMIIIIIIIIIIIVIVIIRQPELGAKLKTFIIAILAALHFTEIDTEKLPIFARDTFW